MDEDEMELWDKWLISIEGVSPQNIEQILPYIQQLAKTSVCLPVRIRMSRIVANGFTYASCQRRTMILLYQLHKDHPWILLEEVLELLGIPNLEMILGLLAGPYFCGDPTLAIAHKTMREEGLPRIAALWLRELEEEMEKLGYWYIQFALSACNEYKIDEYLTQEFVNKHFPLLDESGKHCLLVWAQKKVSEGGRIVIKLAMEERVLQLKSIVASEGQQFDGSYPFAVFPNPGIQEFLRGNEITYHIDNSVTFDSESWCLLQRYTKRVPFAYQFHFMNATHCELDRAFSMTVKIEENAVFLTKTSEYFRFQQRLMKERKEELAELLLLVTSAS